MTDPNSKRRTFLKVFGAWITLHSIGALASIKVTAFTGTRMSRARRSKTGWYVWGDNLNGGFGNGVSGTSSSTPVHVFSSTTWDVLVGGGDENGNIGWFTAGLKSNDTIWGFGRNSHGQLGIGNATDVSTPVQAGSVTTWSKIFGSFSRYNLGIRSDNTLWAWGQNPEGNLGDGTLTQRNNPVQIAGTWTTIAAGYLHTIGIKSNGTLWGWGGANSGQTGTGHIGVRVSSPVQIQTGSTFVKIAAGHSSSYAIRSDGTLWAWGTNGNGQMGIGVLNALKYSTPVQVGGLTTWADVKTGGSCVFAKRNDGTFWCWGANGSGQLGLGNTSTRSSPVQLPGTNWSTILPSLEFTVGLKTDGTLFTWGDGADGVLGTGSTAAASTPVQIPGKWQKIFVSPRHAGAEKI